MADTTYAVKVSDEVKERIQKLIDVSGSSSKDFFSDMVSQFELANAKKQVPMLSADIDEMVKLTTRINNIFINVGERVINLQETYRHEAENETKEKESLIDLLQQQVRDLKRDAVQAEEQVRGLIADGEALMKEKTESERIRVSEVNQLKEVNQKNNEIIASHNEKIDTLSGLVNKYKCYAEENELLKLEISEAQRAAEKFQQENEKLKTLLADKKTQIQTLQADSKTQLDEWTAKYSQDMERQKEKFEIERDRMLLMQREKYNNELDEIRDMYQNKINQLLQISGKSKTERKKSEDNKAN